MVFWSDVQFIYQWRGHSADLHVSNLLVVPRSPEEGTGCPNCRAADKLLREVPTASQAGRCELHVNFKEPLKQAIHARAVGIYRDDVSIDSMGRCIVSYVSGAF